MCMNVNWNGCTPAHVQKKPLKTFQHSIALLLLIEVSRKPQSLTAVPTEFARKGGMKEVKSLVGL